MIKVTENHRLNQDVYLSIVDHLLDLASITTVEVLESVGETVYSFAVTADGQTMLKTYKSEYDAAMNDQTVNSKYETKEDAEMAFFVGVVRGAIHNAIRLFDLR
jgi:hypothetical protein